jgi:CheY-like chemotaxis protein
VEDNVPDAFSIDQMRVRQIMLNLIGNAVKFTSKGKVSVAVGGTPVGPDQFELRFTVTDTGIGIPRDKVQALFQPFVQADSSTTRNYGGTGLGLAICRRLAGLMGGQVLLDSTGPTGSRFSFVCACPIIEFASLESVSVPEKRLVLEEAPRVLVAEDNPANSRLIQLMLKSLGCPCETVSNGRDAVAKHVESPFDVILMDVQMPIMDGMAATGEIRALEGQGKLTLKVHIIALTANAMDGDRERCLVAGMDHYLSKPVRKSELEEALRPVCQRMATQAQTLGIPPA